MVVALMKPALTIVISGSHLSVCHSSVLITSLRSLLKSKSGSRSSLVFDYQQPQATLSTVIGDLSFECGQVGDGV